MVVLLKTRANHVVWV